MTIEKDYQRLIDKDSIVLVVRTSAPIPYLSYEQYMREYSSLKQDEIEARWERANKEVRSQFIVLRNLKGEEFSEGQLAELNVADINYDFMSISRLYIVYLTNYAHNKYEYEPYDFVDVARIPIPNLETVLKMPPTQLTQYLIENNYFGNSDTPVEPKAEN